MKRKKRWVTGGVLALATLGGGTGIAVATGVDGERPLTGSTLDRAVSAALAETGGGTVVDSEVGDDGAAYGVEVRLQDGSQVEVNLDAGFRVIGREADDDGDEGTGSGQD